MRFHRGNQDSVHKVFRRGQAAEHSGESQDRTFVWIHLKAPGQGCLVRVNVGLNVSHGQGVTRNRSTVHTRINLEIVSEYLVTAYSTDPQVPCPRLHHYSTFSWRGRGNLKSHGVWGNPLQSVSSLGRGRGCLCLVNVLGNLTGVLYAELPMQPGCGLSACCCPCLDLHATCCRHPALHPWLEVSTCLFFLCTSNCSSLPNLIYNLPCLSLHPGCGHMNSA